jgi:hypothetical protein
MALVARDRHRSRTRGSAAFLAHRPAPCEGWDKVAYEAESQSPAIIPASAASTRRKRLILLCCEDLRPVACALESALLGRGWEVDVEFGADARPWVQKVPPVRPSVRLLFVPGTVDRALAQQLRAAFRPDPEADLHILGVDDSPGLVQEIERLAGVRTPPRRPLASAPRLVHPLMVETQARRERSWRVGAASALAAFVITLGGMSMVDHSARAPELTRGFEAGITSLAASRPADLDAESSRFHDPVLAAVGPVAGDALDEPLPEDDVEIVLLDEADDALDHAAFPPDEPRPLQPSVVRITVRRVASLATPLAGPEPVSTDDVTPPVTDAVMITTPPLPVLPAGFLPVAGLPISDVATPKRLPKGFLPVAGMTAAPPVTTVDPFEGVELTITEPVDTVDPFGASVDAATP